MGQPVSRPPPPPWSRPDTAYQRRANEIAEEKRQSLEDEWNAKQDKINYFWKVVAAIAIAAAIAAAIL